MIDFLQRVGIESFDVKKYFDSHRGNYSALPNIALAFSGGGYRAMLNGAGVLAAFDSRTSNSTNAGHLGGVLQSSTYVSALSGGGWLIGSIFANNFTSVDAIIKQGEDSGIWQLQNSLFEGPPKHKIQIFSTASYFENIASVVKEKSEALKGIFSTSITDLYGRALSIQLLNATDGGPAYTFSSIQNDSSFHSGKTPMPIIVADERSPGELIVALNSTVFEFNPFEMGSFDPTTFGFAPLKYIGSKFDSGKLAPDENCVTGFDNFGFVLGTSASLFNQFFLRLEKNKSLPNFLKKIVSKLLARIGEKGQDIADYSPNPFFNYHNETNPSAQKETLTLVDGGEDGQNIPLHPVIQPVRHVDVVFAVDSTSNSETQKWPSGKALAATYIRSSSGMMNKTSFPYVPGQDTFSALGMNNRPTFFGCNGTNVTQGNNIPPIIVYLPNSPYSYYSNTSTFGKLSWSIEDRNAMIQNGYNMATQANATRDGATNWPTCVGCAILSRSLERNKQKIPDVCQKCFEQYCWNGTLVETNTTQYNPVLYLTGATKKDTKSGTPVMLVPSGFYLIILLVLALLY
ncbi:Lysophospholipase 1 [Epicoccum nigrum]|nr:Lysophospholipase 1 [Epicoccum nigrum]